MALLLCIDTAQEIASVGLCDDRSIITSVTNSSQQNHAAFLQPAIQNIMRDAKVSFSSIDAVAVVNGPGSYTGLRVGLASAKGICYASGKPLLLLNTLEVMAAAAIEQKQDQSALYCPMIEARRNEVFTAVYSFFLELLLPPQPLIIEEKFFDYFLYNQKMYFFGSGHNKCVGVIKHQNATFVTSSYSLLHTNAIAQQLYVKKQFGDVAYTEPYYTKEFYMPVK